MFQSIVASIDRSLHTIALVCAAQKHITHRLHVSIVVMIGYDWLTAGRTDKEQFHSFSH